MKRACIVFFWKCSSNKFYCVWGFCTRKGKVSNRPMKNVTCDHVETQVPKTQKCNPSTWGKRSVLEKKISINKSEQRNVVHHVKKSLGFWNGCETRQKSKIDFSWLEAKQPTRQRRMLKDVLSVLCGICLISVVVFSIPPSTNSSSATEKTTQETNTHRQENKRATLRKTTPQST